MDPVEEARQATDLFKALDKDAFTAVINTTTHLELPAGTMIAQEGDITFLRIDKANFQRVLGQDSPLKERLMQRGEEQVQNNLLRQLALFRLLHVGEGGTEGCREETFADQEVVFRQGDAGNKAYVILAGAADVYEEEAGGRPRLLMHLSRGSVFGELALLKQQPRLATVMAHGPLRVLSIDGDRFLRLYKEQPEVRAHMKTLKNIYPLAGGGFMTQYLGVFLGRLCLTTITSLIDGTTITSSLVIGQEIFHMSAVLPETDTTEVLHFEDAFQGIERKLVLSGTIIVEVTSQGYWHELGRLYRMVLERTPLTAEQKALFRKQGLLDQEILTLRYQDHETICNCMQVTGGGLRLAIAGGCHTMDDLMKSTGAGTVCGTCRPLLKEMVGQADWTPVYIAEVLPVAKDVQTFRLRPFSGVLPPAKPGQHILIQAHIDGKWVQRPYTISSAAHERRYREITVKREPHGLFSGWLFESSWGGALIRISDPQGDFCVASADLEEPVVCLVAGIGVTPALAMCRSWVQDGITRPLHIDYSTTTRDQLAYPDELQQVAARHGHIDVTLRTTADSGRLSSSHVAQMKRQYPKAHYYICGPSAYQNAVQTYLKEAAVAPDHIHIEAFTPVGEQPMVRPRHPFYLGMALLLAFVLVHFFQLQWPWFEALQASESYKRWSGLFLTLYIAAQFILPFLRWQGHLRAAGHHYTLHKLQGAFAPLAFYIHSTSLGYAYLLVLSLVYFANFILGLLNHAIVAKPQYTRRYQFTWLMAHVVLSLSTVALVVFHVYIVFAFQ